jgi:hypothetical protein
MAVIKIVPMPGAVGDKGDEGAPGAQGPQGPAGQNGLPGTPALWSYQGAYNSASAYAVGDVVVYQGQLYYTKSVTTPGTLPTDTAKFDLIASKGADGTNGTNGSDGAPGAGFGIFYLGNYNPTNGYSPNIAVVRGSDGQLYLAKASGQLADPVGNTAQWEVWIPKGADGTNGTNGTNGADALWDYLGEYDGGVVYSAGAVVTYGGQLWYRNVYTSAGYVPGVGNTYWDLLAAKGADGSGGTANTGDITFDGVKIIGAGTASGDGYNRGTIDLVPDADLITNQSQPDQYLIIDPTAPNHIHIRAGGTQDASTADLFVGGETNHVRVSDGGRSVSISTKPATVINTYTNDNPISNTYFITSNSANVYVGDTLFYPGGDIVTIDSITQDSPSAGLITITANLNGAPASFVAGQAHVFSHEESWNNYWQFGADGVLAGPAMGGLRVHGIEGYSESGNPLSFYSTTSVVINGNGSGEFLNDHSIPANQIATIGDLPTGATGTFTSQDNKTVTVTNGIITSIV